MAGGALLAIGLQLHNTAVCPPPPVTHGVLEEIDKYLMPECPAERNSIDTVYGRFVRDKGRAPFGFELWDAYQEAIGGKPLYLNMKRYCAIIGVDVDGNALKQ